MKTKALLIATIALLFISVAQAQAAPPGFTKLSTVSVTSYTDSTCANQTTCYYMVTAVDSVGHESPGAPCSTSQLCFGGNQAVAIMPSSGTHTVSVGWIASPTTGVSYNVYKAIGPLAASSLAAVVN